MSFWVMKET